MPAEIDETIIQRQLKRMEEIIDKRAEELDKVHYQKYIDVFMTAIDYLKTKPILLYGGLAINEIMPKNLKIYNKYTLPDIDVFTYKPAELTKGLVRHLKKNGYDLTTYGDALHEGTTKIYSQGQQIVDMTFIPKTAFRKLAKKSVMGGLGMRVVDPQYLRMSLHKMLALNMDRWPKVLKRIIAFYQAYPPRKCSVRKIAKAGHHVPEELVDAIYASPAAANAVFMGAREIELIVGEKNVGYFEGVPPVIALVSDSVAVANSIVSQLPDWELTVGELYKTDEQSPLPSHVFLSYKRKKVALLFDAISCFTYNTFKGRQIASLHSIMYIYLSMLCSTYAHFDPMIDAVECISNALTAIQLNTFQSQRKVLQQFTDECFGVSEGMATLRRARLQRRKK